MEERGQKIEGSKYIRDFCNTCGDPIRVSCGKLQLGSNICLGCRGDEPPGMKEARRQHARTLNSRAVNEPHDE